MIPSTRHLRIFIACVAFTAGLSSGFVPRSSFVWPQVPTHTFATYHRATGRSTALSMNLFDRFARVAKANLNNVLKSLEEPEKILNQAIEDMQVCRMDYISTTIYNDCLDPWPNESYFLSFYRVTWSRSDNPMQKLLQLNVDY